MIHLVKHYDGDGREVDEDGNLICKVIGDREKVSVPLMWMDHAAKPDARETAWRQMVERLNNPRANLSAFHVRAVGVSDAIERVREATQPIDTAKLTPSQLAHWAYVQRLAQAHRKHR